MFQYPVSYINNIYVYGGTPYNQQRLCHVDLAILCVCMAGVSC